MKLLVTGCHGFVGGSLARLAVQREHAQAIGVGRRSDAPEAWPGDYVRRDLERELIADVLREEVPDVVVHAAGPSSVHASFTDPLADLRGAVLTWGAVLESVRLSGLSPLVLFISSAAVYGEPQALPIAEDAPAAPVSPYGYHKRAAEVLGQEYAELHGVEVVVLRCFSLFGERQRRLLVWELYERAAGDEHDDVWLDGTGEETRDFLSIEDLETVVAEIAARRGGLLGRVLNVATGRETSALEMARAVAGLVGSTKAIEVRGRPHPGDPVRWCADVSRLQSLLPDWRPEALDTGLKRCVTAWQRDAA
jgi:UDP-glucose 4-epimerase